MPILQQLTGKFKVGKGIFQTKVQRVWYAVLCLWVPVWIKAQLIDPFPFQFRLYTTQQGLSDNNTYRCLQDGYGFLWITTLNGLNRFDGNRFVQYRHLPGDTNSLAENDLPALAIDAENRIWTGGKMGINLLDQTTGKVTRLAGKQWPGEVAALAYDSSRKCIWVAHRNGMARLTANPAVKMDDNIVIPLNQPPNHIKPLPNGWILMHVTRRQSWAYHPEKKVLRKLAPYNWLTGTLVTADSRAWVCGWGTGIHQLHDTGFDARSSYYPELENYSVVISDIAEAPALTGDSVLWVIGTNTGKMLYHKQKKTIIHRFAYKPEWQVGTAVELHNSAYYAPNGTLWICSWLGLEKITNHTNQFHKGELPALHTVQYNMLSGIQPHSSRPGMLWVGIHGSGIALMEGSTGIIEKSWYRISPVRGQDIYYGNRWIQSLYRDKKGTIWGGSYDGFVRIQQDRLTFITLPGEKNKTLYGEYSLLDSTGWLWMTCWKGLVGYHTGTGQKKVYEVEPLFKQKNEFPVLEGLATDALGNKYLGGQFGLLRFTNGLEDTNRLNYLPQGGVERIIGLAVAGKFLLIGSQSGLWQYNLNTGKSSHISAEWVPVHAHGMKPDWLGNVWMYTASGLVKYNPQSGESAVFSTLDGLYAVNNDWATLFAYNGQMYLGHRMAFSKWHPGLAGKNQHRPQVMVSEVWVNGQRLVMPPLLVDTALGEIPYASKSIRFDFTAFEPVQPDALDFRWRILGYDTLWKKAGAERNALFTSLPAGKYTFEIQALNSNGLPSVNTIKVSFQISRPWWQKPWLIILLLAAIGYGVAAMVNWREKRILARANAEVALQKQIAGLQMATLRSQMNPHFIFNSLNSIQKFIWENKQDDASEYLSKFSRLVRSILELSREEMVTLQQEIDLLKLYISLEHRRCNGSFEYEIVVHDEPATTASKIPPMLLQPFVENAIWHGLSPLKNRPGLLKIEVVKAGEGLVITITDNGIGRVESAKIKAARVAAKAQSMGMQLTAQRLHLLQMQLQRPLQYTVADLYPDTAETGTVVTLRL